MLTSEAGPRKGLKPANILITKKGGKLLDFGLAKIEKPVDVAQPGLTLAPEIGDPTLADGILACRFSSNTR